MPPQDSDVDSSGVSFATDEETRLILDAFEEFLDREIRPVEEGLGETWSNPWKRHEDDGRFVTEVREAIEESSIV